RTSAWRVSSSRDRARLSAASSARPARGFRPDRGEGDGTMAGIVAAGPALEAAAAAGRRDGVRSDPSAAEERDRGQHQEHQEQDPGDVAGGPGNATEAQDTGDQGDDEEDDGIAQHGGSPVRPDADGMGPWLPPAGGQEVMAARCAAASRSRPSAIETLGT